MDLLTRKPISIENLTRDADYPECGGLCTFSGIVRNHHEGRRVLKLQYTAYESMAVRELKKLVDAIKQKYPECRIRVQHRLGELQVGEVAIVIAVWAPHRHEAFAACETLMDAIKQRVPIWNKEFYADASNEWVICQHPAHQETKCQHAR